MRRCLPLVLVLLLLPCAAYAQQADVTGVNQLLLRFKTVTGTWSNTLNLLAYGSFGLLAVINLVYNVGVRNLISGRHEMADFISSLVQEVIFLSFFFFLMTSWSTIGPLILTSMGYAAQQAGGIGMHPQDVLAAGVQIANTVGSQMSFLHPGDSITMALCGLIVLLCYGWITIEMIVVIVESYFIVGAGQILMLFGGSRWTADIAISLLRTTLAVGLKLYILQLIASVGTQFINQWVAEVHVVTLQGIYIEIAEAFILAAVTAALPRRFEAIVGGGNSMGAATFFAAAAAGNIAGSMMGKAFIKSITGPAGLVAAIKEAGGLASDKLAIQSAAGSGPSSAVSRAGMLIGSTTKNLAVAKIDDVGRGLSGTRSNLGQPIWRMASDLKEQRRLLDENQTRPVPPKAGTP